MSIETLKEIIGLVPMSGFASLFIGLFFLVLFYLLYKANLDERLDWSDLITYRGRNNKVSLSKCLQLVGGVTATWIMIYVTLAGKISWDLFTAYLAYVGAVEGYSKYLSAKHGTDASPATDEPTSAPKPQEEE